MKRILVTTDFSDKAWNAIVYAIELYQNIPCEFNILNTYDLQAIPLATTISSARVGHFYESIKHESEEGLKLVLDDIRNTNHGSLHVFKTISQSGSLLKVIEKITTTDQYDLILMSTTGVTSAKEYFLGSNTHNVIKNMPHLPILVVPEDAYYKKISNIAFATNFEKIYYKSEVQPIIDLAKTTHAEIKMIHVYDEPKLNTVQNYNSNTLEVYFKNIKYDFHVVPDFTTVEKAIQIFIDELEIDLLTMINYKHSFIERLTREAVIKKITFNTKIPFLIIPSDHT